MNKLAWHHSWGCSLDSHLFARGEIRMSMYSLSRCNAQIVLTELV